MRTKLIPFVGQRLKIKGTVLNKGINIKNKKQETIAIKDVYNELLNSYICDHAWLRIGKRMLKGEEIHRGDVIIFEAKIKEYRKRDGRLDYGFFYVSKIKINNYNRYMVREKYITRSTNV